MLRNLLFADLECFRLLFFVALHHFLILIRRNADDRFQWLNNLIVLHFLRCDQDRSHLNTARSLYNYMHRDFQIVIEWIKIIDLARALKTYSYNFCHFNSP